MNLVMFSRLISRHRNMVELPPYTRFLESLSGMDGVWCATQRSIAEWWSNRDQACIKLRPDGFGSVRVSSSLEGGCVCMDGEVRKLPTTVVARTGDGPVRLEIRVPAELRQISRAMVRHLGCGHVEVVDGVEPALDGFYLSVREYMANTVAARAYPAAALDRLRARLDAVHRESGLPELSIWTLPEDESGAPYRVAFSPRFDVDKAIVNVPLLARLHREHRAAATFYLRVDGPFYGSREIRTYCRDIGEEEFALHGEFVTSAQRIGAGEREAAAHEKSMLESILGHSVAGFCSHGGELRANQTDRTPAATDAAGFLYETTFYDRPYYLPMYLPGPDGIRPTLTMLRHQDDVSLPLDERFGESLVEAFTRQLEEARSVGGVFIPCMHPLYFDLGNYLRRPSSLIRLAAFAPVFAARALRMKRGQLWENQDRISTSE